MFQRIWSLIIKELLASARDPQTRWVVLFSPPFLLVIYAFAITQEISSVTLGVYTQDRGVEARELISRFEGSPTFEEILYLRRDADIAAAIDSRSVDLVLRIGPDFSRQLERGEPANVQLILDGRASNAAQILAGYSGRIVQDFNEDQATALGVPTLTKVVTRVWYNPNLDPLWSAVPALFAVLTAIVGFMVSALSIARERELGTFEQLLVSPLRPTEILIGKTVVFVLIDDKLAGAIALADIIREESAKAILMLQAMGIQCIMLTGDNQQVAEWVGQEIGLDEVIAEVLPEEKAAKVREVQSRGLIVAMTGDGVNDAPALAQANVGIAIGAGTDVAIETADIILVRSSPSDVVAIIELARATYNKMMQNLAWATGYNTFAIPAAAGVFFPWGVILTPALGAVFMSASTVICAINAQLLKLSRSRLAT